VEFSSLINKPLRHHFMRFQKIADSIRVKCHNLVIGFISALDFFYFSLLSTIFAR
jgi:hypothetical protein